MASESPRTPPAMTHEQLDSSAPATTPAPKYMQDQEREARIPPPRVCSTIPKLPEEAHSLLRSRSHPSRYRFFPPPHLVLTYVAPHSAHAQRSSTRLPRAPPPPSAPCSPGLSRASSFVPAPGSLPPQPVLVRARSAAQRLVALTLSARAQVQKPVARSQRLTYGGTSNRNAKNYASAVSHSRLARTRAQA